MRLATLNRWLRRIGLVLVVQVGNAGEATELRIERARAYDARVRARNAP